MEPQDRLRVHGHEPESEIVPALRQEDAEWKLIQRNTFTRWINNHLKKAGESIQNLETDFSDGLKLITLAAVLSQKNLGRYNKKVNFRSQKLENVSLALSFFQEEEKIKIINIDSTHIVDQNKKLIMGLIWALILHYSISLGWTQDNQQGPVDESGPKQKLLNWIRTRLPPGMPLTNFTSDWNDGIALSALVDSIVPGAIPDWQNLHPDKALENTTRALDSAQKHLGVEPLISPEELIHPEVDEMSVMTFLSQFPVAKPVAKPIQREAPLVKCTFTDVEPTPIINLPTEFGIRVADANYKPKVYSVDGNGREVHFTITKKSPEFYSVKYTPSCLGNLTIDMALVDATTGELIPADTKSRHTVTVVPAPRLCPYSEKVGIGEPVELRVENAGNGHVDMVVVDGVKNEISLAVIEGSNGIHSAEYVPNNSGLHSINVFYNGNQLPLGPFPLRVLETAPSSCTVWGRGIEPDGVRVGDHVPINIYCDGDDVNAATALDRAKVEVVDPRGGRVPVKESRNYDRQPSRTFEYTPTSTGQYKVYTTLDGEALPKSPFAVDVSPETSSSMRAFGAGVEGGVAGTESIFEADTHGEADHLAFSVEGPTKTDIKCRELTQSAVLVSYKPEEPGVYKVNVLAGGVHIPKSPFVFMVDGKDPVFHPAASRITGLDPDANHSVGRPVSFQLDVARTNCSDAPSVFVFDNAHHRVPVELHELGSGLYQATFTPSVVGVHHVDCRQRGVALPGAPFSVNVRENIDISKLRMYGPGISGPVVSSEPTHFTIDAKQAGPGAVEVSLSDREGQNVDIDVLDHRDGSFTVKYTAPRPGAYELKVVFAGEEIPPIEINVKPQLDVSGIRVSGLDNGEVYKGHKGKIVVDTGRNVVPRDAVKVIAEMNSLPYEVPVIQSAPHHFESSFTATKEGPIKFKVFVDGVPVKESTWRVLPGCDPSRCSISGLENDSSVLYPGQTRRFTVDTTGAGEGETLVKIGGPESCPSEMQSNPDGSSTVHITPTAVGDYTVNVTFGGKENHVPGSPFTIHVDHPKNPKKVVVSGLESNLRSGQNVNIDVDATHTQMASVECSVKQDDQKFVLVPQTVGRKHRFPFTPISESELPKYVTVDVKYDGEPLPNSPYQICVLPESEPERLEFSSVSSNVTASKEAEVILDVRKCGLVKSVSAEVKGPDDLGRKCKIDPSGEHGVFVVRFLTDIAGKYVVNAHVNGATVSQKANVICKAWGKRSDVSITDSSSKTRNDSVVLNKTTSMAFERPAGTEKMLVKALRPEAVNIVLKSTKCKGRNREVDVIEIMPTQLGTNTLVFYYGGEEIDRLGFDVVAEPEEPKLLLSPENYELQYNNNKDEPIRPGLFERDFKFNIQDSLAVSNLEAKVTMPSKAIDVAEVVDNHDGSILVKYTPKTYGAHELNIFHDGVQVQGTPVKFFVDNYGDGYATVYGPGLLSAHVGEPAAFTVCAKGSAAKDLSVSIRGPAQSTIKTHDNKDGTCSVTWVPPIPGEYSIHVHLGKHSVQGSPFSVLVAGEGQKRAHMSVGSTSEVALNVSSAEIKGISASIKSPSGIEEPCFVRIIEGGRLGVSFTPREAGEHLITVKRDGKLLPKAPFKIRVDKSQVGDASKVELSGEGKHKALCLQKNEILVDTSKAGYGGLSVSVQGPSKAELSCKEVKAGLMKVVYMPTEPGIYSIAIKFADHHVKESPLTINCTGKGAGRVLQQISRRAEQATQNLPDHEANLFLKLPNTSPMNMAARVMDPKGHTEDVEMRDCGENFYMVRFRPHMDGTHMLSVMHKDNHVNGSPFQFTVGPFGEGGAHKVRASGTGVLRGETNQVQSFNLYTREAGAGNLAVSIEGPSKAIMDFKDHKDGNCHVDYKVPTAGEYTIAVKFNDQHIPDSPFKVFVAASTGEVRKLEVCQLHDNVPVGKAYTFTVLTHRANGHLEGKVITPSNETETIDIVPIEEGESYALRFIPKETGNHYIHVTLDGAPMRDSPFRLRVGGKDMSDPTAISASGEGLVHGVTGQKSEFIIKTVNAGAGILNVQIDGPSKVTLDAYELEFGYKVRFTPMAPGDYFAAVKYNGIHIPGSPFKIPVDGKVLGGNGYNETSVVKIDANAKTSKGTVATVPEYSGDATKVVAKGAGLNKFFPGRPAAFTIDTGLAGANLLMVGVVTTKGPCEEVLVKHQGNGHYIVNYKIHERVKGFVFIKYGDKEIPGSPFAIEP